MLGSTQVDVVGLGLNATDILISVSAFPAAGSKVAVRSFRQMPGGQVATAMVACQLWGLRTRYIGRLGDDEAAKIHRDEFANAGVEAQVAVVENCSSAHSFIIVDRHGERTVFWQRDERLILNPEDLERDSIVNSRCLLVDGADTAAATQAARWARTASVPVIADLDDNYPGAEKLLENVDYLIVSRDLPSRISGKSGLRESLQWLQQRFGSRLAAATLGTDGVLAWDGQQFVHASAYKVPAIDTTGAGDIFHAGFVYGLLQEWPLRQMLEFACAASALNCTAAGARGRIATVEEIENLMDGGERYPAQF